MATYTAFLHDERGRVLREIYTGKKTLLAAKREASRMFGAANPSYRITVYEHADDYLRIKRAQRGVSSRKWAAI